MKPKVLIVEDDRAYASFIRRVLEDHDFGAEHVLDGDRALAYLKSFRPDLLILDVNLPGLSGLQLCALLRKDAATAGLPVLMLTALDDGRSRVRGLETGADDYLAKPFDPKELIARLKALLRRVKREQGTFRVLASHGIEVDLERHEASANGRKLDLRPKEYDILVTLLQRPGIVFSPQALTDAIWGPEAVVTKHTITEHIKNLRQKLGDCAGCIETVPEAGYRFVY